MSDILERLRNYNPPDRTIDEQRQIAVDIHEASETIQQLTDENRELRLALLDCLEHLENEEQLLFGVYAGYSDLAKQGDSDGSKI